MGHVKTDSRNRMGRDRLDASLQIGEEGVLVANYCPEAAIDLWFNSKVHRVNCSSHSCPKKGKTASSTSKEVIDVTELTMSDLEAEEKDFNILSHIVTQSDLMFFLIAWE